MTTSSQIVSSLFPRSKALATGLSKGVGAEQLLERALCASLMACIGNGFLTRWLVRGPRHRPMSGDRRRWFAIVTGALSGEKPDGG